METHALSGIHLEIRNGEYVSIAGPRAAARRRCCRSSACSTRPSDGKYWLNGKQVADLSFSRARAHPQPRDRLHLPGLQPDRRPHGLRERRAAAHLPRHGRQGAQGARAGGARAGRHVAPHEALPVAALRRSAAARRRRPRGGRQALDPARRRAHRQPRLEEQRDGDGAPARSCTRTAPPSAWSPTTRASPATRERTIHLFDGRVVEEETGVQRELESRELKRSGFEVVSGNRYPARRCAGDVRAPLKAAAPIAAALFFVRPWLRYSSSHERRSRPQAPGPDRGRPARGARGAAADAQGRGLRDRDRRLPGRDPPGGHQPRLRRRADGPQLHPRHHLRPRGARADRAAARRRRRAAGGGDDRLGERRRRRRGDAPGRPRLRREAVGQRPPARHPAHPDRPPPGAAPRPAPGGGERDPARATAASRS